MFFFLIMTYYALEDARLEEDNCHITLNVCIFMSFSELLIKKNAIDKFYQYVLNNSFIILDDLNVWCSFEFIIVSGYVKYCIKIIRSAIYRE